MRWVLRKASAKPRAYHRALAEQLLHPLSKGARRTFPNRRTRAERVTGREISEAFRRELFQYVVRKRWSKIMAKHDVAALLHARNHRMP